MNKKLVGVLPSILLALIILTVSIFKGVQPRYAFSPATPSPKPENSSEEINIDYKLVYPGLVMPDNPLWYIKVIRDKLQYFLTFNSTKKAELSLLYADKRLQYAKNLFDEEKYDLGYETLMRSEKYLEQAFSDNLDDKEFLEKLANASLKHREMIEQEIMPLAPEDLRPEINSTCDISRNSYIKSRDKLRSLGEEAPINPFDSE